MEKTKKVEKKSLKQAMDAINKKWGEKAVYFGGDNVSLQVDAIPSSSLLLNDAIGVGGAPRGRVMQIAGKPSSGKTIITLDFIKNCQQAGGKAAFIDAEYALTPDWCKKLGVDFDNLIYSQPDHAEECFDMVEMLAGTGEVDLIVLDSLASLPPKSEVESEMGKRQMAPLAQILPGMLRKVVPVVKKNNVSFIIINQVREKIGQMFGNPETTPGGNAVKHSYSLMLNVGKVFKSEVLNDNDVPVGHTLRVKVEKNKVAPPFHQAEVGILYTSGIDFRAEITQLAIARQIITQLSAKKWQYKDYEWVGQSAVKEAIMADEKLQQELVAEIRARGPLTSTISREEAETIEDTDDSE